MVLQIIGMACFFRVGGGRSPVAFPGEGNVCLLCEERLRLIEASGFMFGVALQREDVVLGASHSMAWVACLQSMRMRRKAGRKQEKGKSRAIKQVGTLIFHMNGCSRLWLQYPLLLP